MKFRLMRGGALVGLLSVALIATGGARASSLVGSHGKASPPLQVVVAENFWGSIARQEAGTHARVTSIITNPNADPHSYEPTTGDARLLATARYVILNGAGYDPWGQRLLNANPVKGRRVLIIGDLIGKKEGDNPHMWYSPSYVERVALQITFDLQSLDPADRAYFAQQHTWFMNVGLKAYHQEISLIARKYHGVPVGSTESIFQYLAQGLHLNLISPYGFMKAISEGTEPTAQDKVTFDRQIAKKQIKVLVYNSQTSTPDTNSLEKLALSKGIPIAPVTETLVPPTATFQSWQVSELRTLQRALAKATGR